MKKKLILALFLFSFFIVGCSNKDALKFKEDYESLNGQKNQKDVSYRVINIEEDNPIIYSSFKEVTEKIDKKESFIVYVGFSACPWCRSVIPYVLESAKENKIDKIYYVNVRSDNKKESDLRGYYKLDNNNQVVVDVKQDDYYKNVLESLKGFLTPYTLKDEAGTEIPTGEDRLYAPTVIIYKDGKCIALSECISDLQTDGYQELSDEMIKDIKNKANELFKKFK